MIDERDNILEGVTEKDIKRVVPKVGEKAMIIKGRNKGERVTLIVILLFNQKTQNKGTKTVRLLLNETNDEIELS